MNDDYTTGHFRKTAMCGVNQRQNCTSPPLPAGFGGWETMLSDFDQCDTGYPPLMYESVVMFSAAMDAGIKLGKFTKSDVTSQKLQEMLDYLSKGGIKVPKKGDDGKTTQVDIKEYYGPCLAGTGTMRFEYETQQGGLKQERKGDLVLTNLQLVDGATVRKSVISIPGGSGTPMWITEEKDNVQWGSGTKRGYPWEGTEEYITGLPPICLPGSYLSMGECKKTDPGYFQLEGGAFNQNPCQPGEFSEKAGQTGCDLCPTGAFQDQVGQSSCKSCGSGHYASLPGSKRCDPCAMGSYANTNGTVACALCERGSYQTEVGATNCTSCPDDKTTLEVGSRNSTFCVFLLLPIRLPFYYIDIVQGKVFYQEDWQQ